MKITEKLYNGLGMGNDDLICITVLFEREMVGNNSVLGLISLQVQIVQ